MDWQCHKGVTACAFILMLAMLTPARTASATATTTNWMARGNFGSPYLDMAMCPLRAEPWTCARQQSARLLNLWDEEIKWQWRKLQIEADRQLNATLEKRGYSMTATLTKERPSTLLKKIEIGTNYMKKCLAETMDGFLGREYDYQQSANALDEDYADRDENAQPNGDADDEDDEEEDNDDDDRDEDDDDRDDQAEAGDAAAAENAETAEGLKSTGSATANGSQEVGDNKAGNSASPDDGVEFIEIPDDESPVVGQVKKPGGGGGNKNKNKNRNKNKRKGQHQVGQPATLVVVQEAAHPVEQWSGGQGHGHGGGAVRPLKQKRKKRKKQPQGGVQTVVVDQPTGSGHLGLDLLNELVHSDDLLSGGGGKRKHKRPSKYGRSNGVTRGKKKKRKKTLAKLALVGTFLKAKIELLLKILGAHLQIKFFAIALIGLLINIARFWIDVKRGGVPQKVVYVEHAHHQHHYEDHGDEWNEPASGYWKRSMTSDSGAVDDDDGAGAGAVGAYVPQQLHPQLQHQHNQPDPHKMAYQSYLRK